LERLELCYGDKHQGPSDKFCLSPTSTTDNTSPRQLEPALEWKPGCTKSLVTTRRQTHHRHVPRTGTVPKLVNGWTLLLGRRSWKESCSQEEAWQPAQGLDQDPEEVVVRPSVQRVSKRRRKAGSGKGGRPHCAAGLQLVHQRTAPHPARDHPAGGERPTEVHHQQERNEAKTRLRPDGQDDQLPVGHGEQGPRVRWVDHHVQRRGLRRGQWGRSRLWQGGGWVETEVAIKAAVRLRGERGLQLLIVLPVRLWQGELVPLWGQLGAHLPLHLLLLHYQQALWASQLPTATHLKPSSLQGLPTGSPALTPVRGAAPGHVAHLQLLPLLQQPALGHPGQPERVVPRPLPPRRHRSWVGEQEDADQACLGLNPTLLDCSSCASDTWTWI